MQVPLRLHQAWLVKKPLTKPRLDSAKRGRTNEEGAISGRRENLTPPISVRPQSSIPLFPFSYSRYEEPDKTGRTHCSTETRKTLTPSILLSRIHTHSRTHTRFCLVLKLFHHMRTYLHSFILDHIVHRA